MLKGSGSIFAICPTMNQLEKLTIALVENEFTDIESTEHIIRTIEAREGKTRHSFQGIGHTTYLCFARKAFFGRELRKSIVKPPADKTTSKTPKKTTKKTTNLTKKSPKKSL
jgi:tRNA (adenine57-N1/adenine58-N1)-methyltransferase